MGLFIFGANKALAQSNTDSAIVETDLPTLLFGKKNKAPDSIQLISSRKYSIAPLPVVGYNPANGFIVGGALSAATNLGNPANTRQSSGLLNVTITSKRQIIFIARTGIALPENKWLLESDFRYLIFTQDTYGLGTRIGKEGSASFAQPQPMNFNYTRIYANALKRISRHMYAGLGLAIDVHNKINDKLLNPDALPPFITYHFAYNTANGFATNKYATNGVVLSFRWDSRDNIANPYRGWFASIVARHNTTLLGSQRNSTGVSLDGRYYVNVERRRPMHLLAFWVRGDFFKEGTMPFLALPSIGWDAYNRTGRGYVQGRFRGHSMAYFESEYRFPLMRNGLLGGVLFTNFTSTAGNGQALLHTIAPAAGLGVRIKLDAKARTNITIDYGWGAAGSTGLFFNLQEAF